MAADFEPFATWADVLAAAQHGDRLYYKAPLDRLPRYVVIDKIYKNGKLRVDPLSNQAAKFTADAGHLKRFLRREW